MEEVTLVPEAVRALPAHALAEHAVWAGRRRARFQPFCSSNVRYFYFARNAVWLTVKMLGLDKGEVLMPAYHHGVEVEARGRRRRHAALLPGGQPVGRGPGGRGEEDRPEDEGALPHPLRGLPGPGGGDAARSPIATGCR